MRNLDGPLGVDRRAEVRDVAAQKDRVQRAGMVQDPLQGRGRTVQIGDTGNAHCCFLGPLHKRPRNATLICCVRILDRPGSVPGYPNRAGRITP